MNIAIVLSGGTGSRLGAEIPKQYIKVKGKPIILYCLEVLEKCEAISAIQIVAEERWRNLILENQISKLKGFSNPGINRQLSIYNALEDIKSYAKDEDIVVVHDAARPCVSGKMLEELICSTKKHEGAIPVLPMKDTVYISEDSKKITSLVERKQIFAGQAPEAFLFGKYYEANIKLLPKEILKINGSTEPAIIAGMNIAMIPGDEDNFKITTLQDLDRFQKIMKEKK